MNLHSFHLVSWLILLTVSLVSMGCGEKDESKKKAPPQQTSQRLPDQAREPSQPDRSSGNTLQDPRSEPDQPNVDDDLSDPSEPERDSSLPQPPLRDDVEDPQPPEPERDREDNSDRNDDESDSGRDSNRNPNRDPDRTPESRAPDSQPPQGRSPLPRLPRNDSGDPTRLAYYGTLRPVNKEYASSSGTILISIASGRISVSVEGRNFPRKTLQFQNVHEKSRCPAMTDDSNGDGWVDAIEATRTSGLILIPLDDDLSSQASIRFISPSSFPITDSAGRYSYSSLALLHNLLEDLRSPDSDPNDSLVKLGSEENLDLSNRVVIVHGISENTRVPPTVERVDGWPREAGAPVACAKLSRVKSVQPPVETPDPAPTPNGSEPYS